MPKKKVPKRPAVKNPGAYYYVVEIRRPGGLTHAIATGEHEAKIVAKTVIERDGYPSEIFRINLTDREKRIAFLRVVVKDPNATWKKIARPIPFRPTEAAQPTEKTNDTTTDKSRDPGSRVPGSHPKRGTGEPEIDDADDYFARALGSLESQEENSEDESRDAGGTGGPGTEDLWEV